MSVIEIKAELARLTLAERVEVHKYLKALRWLEDPAMPARVDAAMARMDAGEKITSEELKRRFSDKLGVTAT
ncbi:MAG: hypothetical protein WC661_18205 [Opitutaceae bacterium]|jgi:hypothetical protein